MVDTESLTDTWFGPGQRLMMKDFDILRSTLIFMLAMSAA